MSPFHFCLSAAKNLSSFQLLPASLITDLLHLFLGLPLFLFPWGFQNRAAFGISPPSFRNVWPIHLNFLLLISTFISSCPVTFHRSLLEIIFGHHILNIYLIHLYTKVCIDADLLDNSVLSLTHGTNMKIGMYNINTIRDYTRGIHRRTPATGRQRRSYILAYANGKWIASCQQTRQDWHQTVTESAVTGNASSVGELPVQANVFCSL